MFTDVSIRHSFGHLWQVDPMGHLRIYTAKTLKKLFEIYHFSVLDLKGIGINYQVSFGKSHPMIAKIANTIFSSPNWNSAILIVAQKNEVK